MAAGPAVEEVIPKTEQLQSFDNVNITAHAKKLNKSTAGASASMTVISNFK